MMYVAIGAKESNLTVSLLARRWTPTKWYVTHPVSLETHRKIRPRHSICLAIASRPCCWNYNRPGASGRVFCLYCLFSFLLIILGLLSIAFTRRAFVIHSHSTETFSLLLLLLYIQLHIHANTSDVVTQSSATLRYFVTYFLHKLYN